MSDTATASNMNTFNKEPVAGGIAADRLKGFIERLEHLENEKRQIQEFLKEVFDEAKSAGFDVRVIRQILRLRKQDAETIAEQEELLDLYRQALGML